MIAYFECDMGAGLREYRDLRSAISGITREVGTANRPRKIRKATEDDINNVRAMGGRVPNEYKLFKV